MLRYKHFCRLKFYKPYLARRISRVADCGVINTRSCAQSCRNQDDTRFNPLNIQMLSEVLHKQIFPNAKIQEPNNELIKKCIEHLSNHELWGKTKSEIQDVNLTLPPLLGKNIDEHFCSIAKQQSHVYYDMAQYIAQSALPPMPGGWEFREGWTKYEDNNGIMHVTAVDFPSEDALVFDVEVLQTEGLFPTLAVAASPNAWYSWVSPKLIEDKSYQWLVKPSPDLYIPLETKTGQNPASVTWKERLVVGHSVSYDRSYVKEQYYIKGPKTYFLDTLSLHMCVSGLTSLQRNMWAAAKSGRKNEQDWMQVGTGNKLTNLYQLYCDGNDVDKSLVNVFIDGTMDDVRANFQDLMSYCAQDVSITHEVFSALWPSFLERFPHPVSFAGMLEMSSAYLPVDSSWKRYIQDADDTFGDLEQEMKRFLMDLADEACNYQQGNRFKDDPWLWALDWSVQNVKTKVPKKPTGKTRKAKEKEPLPPKETTLSLSKHSKASSGVLSVGDKHDQSSDELNEEWLDEWSLIKMERSGKNFTVEDGQEHSDAMAMTLSTIPSAEDIMYKRRQHMPGYPLWYRKLCPKDRELGASLVSPQCQTAPLLLRMTWDGFPLHYNRKHGWGYLVPGRTDNLESCDHDNTEEDREKIERPVPESHFPTLAFQRLWSHDQDHKETDGSDDNPENNNELHIQELTDSDLWSEQEYEEMRKKTSSSDVKHLTPVASSLQQGRNKGSSGRHSKPTHHHGVGPFNDVDLPGVWFFRIPHKDGDQYRCGNPLAKDYISKLDDGTLLTAGDRNARRTLLINKMISFWRNAQKRIKSQMPVWLGTNDLPSEVTRSSGYASDQQCGVIIPRVTTAGTVTRRAVEPTWLTASNPREDRVGSELKSLVRAPPGYCLVGADVDSQELWIAAVLGDANFAGMHGSTAFGWMTLQGKKSEGTDLHSKTASTIGISRDHAKVFNYGRIYGAGQKFAERLLLQFNHRLTDVDARQKAERLYASTKGKARYLLSDYGHELAHEFGYPVDEDGCVEPGIYWELTRKTRRRRKNRNTRKSIEAGRRWQGGSESEMFNKLEMIAQSEEPRTPVLECRISRALEPWVVGSEFITSRVNWVVQSSAVDYLHLMLVAMKWLFTDYNIAGRFCISIHDEVRYLVSHDDRYRAALALQITNLLTRAMFAYKLGMEDLPQSVAFFSAVDIDKVLRKEVNLDCKTPSNPQGLDKGQGIPPGEALDIYQILQRTNNGCLNKTQELMSVDYRN